MKKVGIIGGGVAGLASAARLQKQGYDVTVFEKEDIMGGRMGCISDNGFKFDLAPTIVMMPEIYQAVFKDCGENPDEYIPMEQLPILYDLFFEDNTYSFPSDLPSIHRMLESIEKDSSKGFYEYLNEIYERYIIARDEFITKSFRKPSDFYNPRTIVKGMQLKTFDSADHLIGKFIQNDTIKKMLAFQTLYIGISPNQGPSLYSIIPMIEMIYGVWFMKGGMRTMADGMIKLCEKQGVKLNCNADVSRIVIEDGTAKGIIVNGERKDFDIILNTSDFPFAMQELIEEEKYKGKYTDEKIDNMDYACSAFLIYLGLNKSLKDKIELHNVVFSNNFEKNIEDIFSGVFPEDPSVYVYAASTKDADLAPEGKDGVYLLAPVPELKIGKINWDDKEEYAKMRQIVLDKVKTIPSLADIEEHIEVEHSITPMDLKNKFNAKFGAAFGLRPTLAQSNHLRPQAALKQIQNLYFAGASNHPGAGVPIVLTSAEIAVKEIIKDDK